MTEGKKESRETVRSPPMSTVLVGLSPSLASRTRQGEDDGADAYLVTPMLPFGGVATLGGLCTHKAKIEA